MKKSWMMALCIALAAMLSISSTMAYLSDSDSDVNVMTLGNVYIDQLEHKRVDDDSRQTELENFQNDVPLYPAVYAGESIAWAPEAEWVKPGDQAWKVVADNDCVVDKFVSVENTGKSSAYVRTIFAYEVGKNGVADDMLHFVMNGANVDGATWTWTEPVDGYVTIDDELYAVMVATYTDKLASGATTIPSLKQVCLDKRATNDTVASFGDTFEIRVLSQAVQTEGFADAQTALDEAFKPVTAEKVIEWFTGMKPEEVMVESEEELLAEIEAGAQNIALANDITVQGSDNDFELRNKIATINLNGHTLTMNAQWAQRGGHMTLEGNGTIQLGTYGAFVINPSESSNQGAQLTVKGLSIKKTAEGVLGDESRIFLVNGASSRLVIDRCEIDGGNHVQYGIRAENGSVLDVKDSKIVNVKCAIRTNNSEANKPVIKATLTDVDLAAGLDINDCDLTLAGTIKMDATEDIHIKADQAELDLTNAILDTGSDYCGIQKTESVTLQTPDGWTYNEETGNLTWPASSAD